MQIKQYLESLTFDSYFRGDCPECEGVNTFSAIRDGGAIIYHCFRASCKLHGKISYEIPITTLSEYDWSNTPPPKYVGTTRFSCPEHFTRIDGRESCIKFLERYNSYASYLEGRLQLRYDPKLDRLVFLIVHEGECYGAIGRLLGTGASKWYVYPPGTNPPFLVSARSDQGRGVSSSVAKRTRSAIVVEDCLSAVVCSTIVDGLALCGTNLMDHHVPYLANYQTLIVALDKDASDKAIEIERRLSFYVPTVRVLLLERDLKYEDNKKIEELLSCLIN